MVPGSEQGEEECAVGTLSGGGNYCTDTALVCGEASLEDIHGGAAETGVEEALFAECKNVDSLLRVSEGVCGRGYQRDGHRMVTRGKRIVAIVKCNSLRRVLRLDSV